MTSHGKNSAAAKRAIQEMGASLFYAKVRGEEIETYENSTSEENLASKENTTGLLKLSHSENLTSEENLAPSENLAGKKNTPPQNKITGEAGFVGEGKLPNKGKLASEENLTSTMAEEEMGQKSWIKKKSELDSVSAKIILENAIAILKRI